MLGVFSISPKHHRRLIHHAINSSQKEENVPLMIMKATQKAGHGRALPVIEEDDEMSCRTDLTTVKASNRSTRRVTVS